MKLVNSLDKAIIFYNDITMDQLFYKLAECGDIPYKNHMRTTSDIK